MTEPDPDPLLSPSHFAAFLPFPLGAPAELFGGIIVSHCDLGSTYLDALYFRGIILQAESRKENEEVKILFVSLPSHCSGGLGIQQVF